MKIIKLICKGILVYTTALAAFLFIGGIDDVIKQGYFIPSLLLLSILAFSCYQLITQEDLKKILFIK